MKVSIYGTGGGFGCLEKMTKNGGASEFLVEAKFPYASWCTESLIGFTPDQFVSEEVAVALASEAFNSLWEPYDEGTMGIGYTCSLRSAGERANRNHRISICAISQSRPGCNIVIAVYNGILPKYNFDGTLMSRAEQDEIVATWIHNILPSFNHPFQWEKECLTEEEYLWFTGKKDAPFEAKRAYPAKPEDVPELILSGSFNPPHEAHKHMLDTVAADIGRHEYLELSIQNYVKKPLNMLDLARRLRYLKEMFSDSKYGIILTTDALVVDKVETWTKHFKAVPDIIMGADTWNRFMEQMAQENSVPRLFWQSEFARYHPTIHVFQRAKDSEKIDLVPFEACKYVNPDLVRFWEMPPELINTSSTEIRNARTNESPLPGQG